MIHSESLYSVDAVNQFDVESGRKTMVEPQAETAHSGGRKLGETEHKVEHPVASFIEFRPKERCGDILV